MPFKYLHIKLVAVSYLNVSTEAGDKNFITGSFCLRLQGHITRGFQRSARRQIHVSLCLECSQVLPMFLFCVEETRATIGKSLN
jgi:hypothetical protein